MALPLAAGAETPAEALATTSFAGHVRSLGQPVAGATVSIGYGDPRYTVSVFSDEAGRYRAPALPAAEAYVVRVRHAGHRDLRVEVEAAGTGAPAARELDFALEPETDPAALVAQLPSNRWYDLVLEQLPDPDEREQLVRQCTFCHQQGSPATRLTRSEEEWDKVLSLMARMGAVLDPKLRAKLPGLFNAAYEPSHAVPALLDRLQEPGFAPVPVPAVRSAVIEEWELGSRSAMQHDVVLHPDGRLYSVDMMHDRLYRLDPRQPGGTRASFDLPREGLPLGGVFGTKGGAPLPPNADAHVGPHSIQVAPDGALWITLALGNRLARFDPESERWTIHAQPAGFYPHTLRFDAHGRIWYTLAASNHLGRFDPATGEFRTLRLPAPSFGQALALRMLPALLWIGRHVELSGLAERSGFTLPVPYGVDIGPDGSVWFSQLNAHRIGRVDPESFEIEMIDTPFSGPRRLRFDSKGGLWIPGFSSGVISRFDPATRDFRSWELPIAPRGTETPYALFVDRRTDTVWICGTNSDTLIRFEPEAERFTIYPLPTRVTYTREVAFDAQGRVWTSNSNGPTWQIEGGVPKVVRIDPAGAPPPAAFLARNAAAE